MRPNRVQLSLQTVPFLHQPIGFSKKEGEAATPSVIKGKCNQLNWGPLRKMSYISLGGIVSGSLGIITTILGFIKESTTTKWFGAIITFLGVEALASGFLGGIDLSRGLSQKDRTTFLKNLAKHFFAGLRTGQDYENKIKNLLNQHRNLEEELINTGAQIILDEKEKDFNFKDKVKGVLEFLATRRGTGEKQIENLISQLEGKTTLVTLWALLGLGCIDKKNFEKGQINAPLINLLLSSNTPPSIKIQAAICFAKHKSPQAFAYLMINLEERNASSYLIQQGINELSNLIKNNTISGLQAMSLIEKIQPETINRQKLKELKETAFKKAMDDLFASIPEEFRSKQSSSLEVLDVALAPIITSLLNDLPSSDNSVEKDVLKRVLFEGIKDERYAIRRLSSSTLSFIYDEDVIDTLVKNCISLSTRQDIGRTALSSMIHAQFYTISAIFHNLFEEPDKSSDKTKKDEVQKSEGRKIINRIKERVIVDPLIKFLINDRDRLSGENLLFVFDEVISVLGQFQDNKYNHKITKCFVEYLKYFHEKTKKEKRTDYIDLMYNIISGLSNTAGGSKNIEVAQDILPLLDFQDPKTNKRSPMITCIAAHTLGAIGNDSPSVLSGLYACLTPKEGPALTSAAIEALGKILENTNNETAIERLKPLLQDGKMQAKAELAIAKISGEKIVESTEVRTKVRPDTVDILSRLIAPGSPKVAITDVPVLEKIVLVEADPDRIQQAEKYLKGLGKRTTTEDLINYLNSDNELLAAWSAEQLGEKEDIAVEQSLIKILNKKDSGANVKAASAIALLRNPLKKRREEKTKLACECLIEGLRAGKLLPFLKFKAINVLEKTGNIEALDVLLELQTDEDPEIKTSAKQVFGNIEPREKRDFIKRFKSFDKTTKNWQKEFLNPYLNKRPKIIPVWLEYIAKSRHYKNEYKLGAISCLEHFGGSEAVNALQNILQCTTQEKIRVAARTSLERVEKMLFPEEVRLGFLKELTTSVNPGILFTSQNAKKLTGSIDDKFKPELRTLLRDLISSTYENFNYNINGEKITEIKFNNILEAALKCLAALKDQDDLKFLEMCLNSPSNQWSLENKVLIEEAIREISSDLPAN